ncbi:isoprenylcysteine carboxyl methyltransferase family protein [Shimia aestuarii]|uniref:isoprenylcysteine carboxyl methyltransferase family protein n=1 Tax=Shimia aestuarii TaxID=254406 RepID=UPI001FB4F068|nr:isoprenylcysteine carboxyl methyltransferase family protein [Shimia aestuarii]
MFEIIFIIAAVAVRFLSLSISMRNERRLREEGAVEYGANASKAIAAGHIAFYLAAITESYLSISSFTWGNGIGVCLYVLSIGVLFWVIAALGRLWTVKLYIAPDHCLRTSWLFKRFRHPNYFLNILPELVGFAIALNAWRTLLILGPVYVVILSIRIRQEEQIMRETFPQY